MRRTIGSLLVVLLTSGPIVHAAGELEAMAAQAAAEMREQFKDEAIREEDLAISVIDLRDPDHPRTGNYRGDQPMFPASVVKLFYLAYAQRLLEDGELADSEELQRGLRDMIVDSSNDATSFILDTITDAPNGGVLPPAEMEQWSTKRNVVNRYFADLGYAKINVNQKAYCEGPYGRERLFIGPKFENRNKLTTDATAKLLAEIAERRFVSQARSEAMMALLARDRAKKTTGPDDQAHGFIAGALPPGVKVWSKAGWTSTARHDAAYIESEDGAVRAVIVIFTTGHGRSRKIIPALGKTLYRSLSPGRPVGSAQPFVK
jgi:beta-lactamase class A